MADTLWCTEAALLSLYFLCDNFGSGELRTVASPTPSCSQAGVVAETAGRDGEGRGDGVVLL